MDEPSEGLAPTIVERLIDDVPGSSSQEGMAILLVEQNLGVATAVAERQLVMVAGRIATETTADELVARSRAAAPLPRRRAARRVTRLGEASVRHDPLGHRAKGGDMPTVVLVGTLDTKGQEYAYLADRIREHGVDVVLVDAGIVGEPLRPRPTSTREEVAARRRRGRRGARRRGRPRRRGRDDGARRGGGRPRLHAEGRLDAIGGLGGSGGSSIATHAMRAAAGRRAEADGLDGRLGRHEPVRRRRST